MYIKCFDKDLKCRGFINGNNNSGDNNSGNYNSGNYNSGNGNSGDFNSGEFNSGHFNAGNLNTGYENIGNFNSGDSNSGNFNTGYANSGNYNSGDWNKCNGSGGVFCTEEQTIRIFDKDTNMTLSEFRRSKYNRALRSVKLELTKWIEYTEEEKKEDDKKRLIGGYLKEYSYKEACANWWIELTEENRETIKSIPNFDADKFYEITGIIV